MKDMERIYRIQRHPVYQEQYRLLIEAEKERIFCGHSMEHFLDVARLMYIYNLEERAGLEKELIYAAALLHDIGRYEQISRGTPHHISGARIAEEIMADCGFGKEEISAVQNAIRGHRNAGSKENRDLLTAYLYRADKQSRNCFACQAEQICNWPIEKKKSEYTILGRQAMRIGGKEFDIKNKTYIMGILNVTPDSFSDGGKFNNLDAALYHAEEMIRDGADIVDIGGESTRPGHTVITEEEEIARVTPVIEAVKSRFDIPVSIDTYKGKVTKAALQAGADLVNDIWGFKHDRQVAELTAEYKAACCLMHNRHEAVYQDFLKDMVQDMEECVRLAREAGVAGDKIMLDPGVGFGKTYEMNLEAIHHVEVLHSLGFPILLGTSRKSVIGLTLDLPADQRVEGTLATTVIGVMKGCAFVRVHDIKENKRVIQMTEAILGR